MHRLKQLFKHIVVGSLIVTFFLSPTLAFAANYGEGSYGGGSYGNGSTPITTTISSTVSSTFSSVSNSIGAFFCTNQAPASAPNLYQINTTGNTATVYFAPAGGSYTTHFISFGQGNKNEGNGADLALSSSKGAMSYKVAYLAPNTFYTFKVRGGNGCKPGPWSSDLTIKTGAKNTKAIAKYYPKKQAKYIAAKPPKKQSFFNSVVNKVFPKK